MVLVACVATFGFCFQDATTAQETATPNLTEELAAEYVEEFVMDAELRATLAFVNSRQNRLQPDQLQLQAIRGFDQFDAATQKQLSDTLSQNAQPLIDALQSFNDEQRQALNLEKERWLVIRSARNDADLVLSEVEANKQTAGQLASMFSLDNRWFWLCGLIAVCVLFVVSLHDRRHEYRRRLAGAKARAMGVARMLRWMVVGFGVMTLTTFFLGGYLFDLLTSVGSGGEGRSLATMQQEVEDLRTAATQREKELADLDTATPAAVDGAAPEWRTAHEHLRTSIALLAVRRQVAMASKVDAEALLNLRAQKAQRISEIRKFESRKAWIRAGIGGGIIGVVGFGAYLLVRGVRRRKRLIEETCPMCLNVGTLEIEGGRGRRDIQSVTCNSVISEEPYEECNFSFNAVYRDMPKLCFPTLGHPQSGKTHWLAMTYRELNQQNFDSKVQFDKIRSEATEDLDRIVDDILGSRMDPAATQVARIPHPVLFNFRDNDPFGASNVLVSIFDYSGEVTERQTLNDFQRRRALDADGYIFFLDPTARSDDQVKELVNFREDVRVIRNVRSGQAVSAPVALCVSKIDLLVNEEYADPDGGGPVGQFYEELSEIDPSGNGMTLDIIQARSEAIQRLRDTIWPGWQIEKQIHDLFGGRCTFFPLTPVGLNDLGERDLRNRLIEPFAILDPLMWLLHMNGYPVLR